MSLPALRTLHLIGTAHIDPVWLWDWREGLNEGLITVESVLSLMDEHPKLTFTRGESSIYEHIEQNSPRTFERIQALVAAGRWEVVGGTYVQPDTNMTGGETLIRQYQRGKRYFRDKFGVEIKTGWAPDSFGHSAGLPGILSHCGIENYACTRPYPVHFPVEKSAFWWEAPSGERVLVYRPNVGPYCTTRRDETPSRMDEYLKLAGEEGLRNVGCFWGLGNHGGGPTRRLIQDLEAWKKAHPEVRVIYSGLQEYFDALRRELAEDPRSELPVVRGELNFCLRGCYSSVQRFKTLYRRTEALVSRAETTCSVLGAALPDSKVPCLENAWEAVLFNAFHDILPGSGIERIYDEQSAWIGVGTDGALKAETRMLNRLAREVDTRVRKPAGDNPSLLAFLLWNPHPFPFHGPIELEACMDSRHIAAYRGVAEKLPVELLDASNRALPFQRVESECRSYSKAPWRVRVVFSPKIPACGWSMLSFGYREGAKVAAPRPPGAWSSAPGSIENERWRVVAKQGTDGLRIYRDGKLFPARGGLQFAVYADESGSWGGMGEEPGALFYRQKLEQWAITAVQVRESGPERATLWVRFAGERSRVDLLIHLSRDRSDVEFSTRLFWNERSRRLKMLIPGGDEAVYAVPGGEATRGEVGEVPGTGWVKIRGKGRNFGFASNALYSFDTDGGFFRPTLARSSRFGDE
ncbi:MAG: glycoside hydrolase family 38 C-terminal domain-containing protein, partial [Syntrophales bacterium]